MDVDIYYEIIFGRQIDLDQHSDCQEEFNILYYCFIPRVQDMEVFSPSQKRWRGVHLPPQTLKVKLDLFDE